MKNVLLISLAFYVFNIGLFAESKGKKLFVQKCATCHAFKGDVTKSQRLAPPIKNVLFHMNEAFKTKKEAKKHIMDFVINPTKEKAICKSVKKFGLMASQKNLISNEELTIIADWMMNDLQAMTEKEHSDNEKRHKSE